MGELKPGAGEGVGELLGVREKAAGDFFVSGIGTQGDVAGEHRRAMFLSGIIGIGDGRGSVFGDPLVGAGRALSEHPFVAEKVFEVIIAPAYSDDALSILKVKPNRIILVQKNVKFSTSTFRTLLNGVIIQDKDFKTETASDFTTVTSKSPKEQEIKDLIFANKLVKHTKSNTIVFAKNNTLVSSGTGQTSRVDALRQGVEKAKSFGFDLKGAVMASDAFFPFADCVEIAHKVGIDTVIQPGGSIKDKDSIEYCNAKGMSMVFTGTRHFKH